MIVCVCSNVSERKIRQAVDDGLTQMSELRAQLEVGTCCGKCNSCAKRVLREQLAASQTTFSPIAIHPVTVQPMTFAAMAA